VGIVRGAGIEILENCPEIYVPPGGMGLVARRQRRRSDTAWLGWQTLSWLRL